MVGAKDLVGGVGMQPNGAGVLSYSSTGGRIISGELQI